VVMQVWRSCQQLESTVYSCDATHNHSRLVGCNAVDMNNMLSKPHMAMDMQCECDAAAIIQSASDLKADGEVRSDVSNRPQRSAGYCMSSAWRRGPWFRNPPCVSSWGTSRSAATSAASTSCGCPAAHPRSGAAWLPCRSKEHIKEGGTLTAEAMVTRQHRGASFSSC
jgi:hypothetical protein